MKTVLRAACLAVVFGGVGAFLGAYLGGGVAAQGLFPLQRHYPLELTTVDALRSDARYGQLALAVAADGFLYLGRSEGVSRFDGRREQLIASVPGVTALHALPEGSLLVGSFGALQRLVPTDRGAWQAQPVAVPGPAFGAVRRLIEWGQRTVAYGSDLLAVLTPAARADQAPQVRRLLPPAQGFTGVAVVGDQLWVNVPGQGLQQLDLGTDADAELRLRPLPFGRSWAGRELQSAVRVSEYTTLVGASSAVGGVPTLWRFAPGLEPELFTGPVASWLRPRGLSALGEAGPGRAWVLAQRRGALLIDGRRGAMLAAFDSTTGLPADAVFATAADPAGGLWLAHAAGLTYLAPQAPVQDYGFVSGLSGQVYALRAHGGWLYAATSAGLFTLPVAELSGGLGLRAYRSGAEPKSVDETSARLQKNNPAKRGQKPAAKARAPLAPNAPTDARDADTEASNDVQLVRAQRLRWRPVRGLTVACYDLAVEERPEGSTLVAASLAGLYVVEGESARQAALPFRYTRAALPARAVADSWYVALAAGQGVAVLDCSDDCVELSRIDLGPAAATSLAEGPDGRLWIGTDRGLAIATFSADARATTRREPGKRVLAGGARHSLQRFALGDRAEPVLVLSLLGQPAAITRQGITRWVGSAPARDAALQPYAAPQARWLPRTLSEAWVLRGDTLIRLRSEGADTTLIPRLLPQSIGHAAADGAGLWALAGTRLVRLRPDAERPFTPPLALLGLELRSGNQPESDPAAELSPGTNAVELTAAVADYLRPEAVRLRHRLRSADSPDAPWSPWASTDRLTLANLPSGAHQLDLQALTAGGQASAVRAVTLRVATPWFQTRWGQAGLVAVALLMLGGAVFAFDRSRRYQIRRLDRLVREKTEHLSAQNTRLAEQSLELERQRDALGELNAQLSGSLSTIQDKKSALELALSENAQHRRHVEQQNAELAQSLITIQRQQEQLVQSEKMSALGFLVAGVAHDINSPLGAIKGSAQTMRMGLNDLLQRLPGLLHALPAQALADFDAIVDAALRQPQALSTREARELRQTWEALLADQVPGPEARAAQVDVHVDALVRLGLSERTPAVQRTLALPQCAQVLEAALGLVKLARGLDTILQSADKTQRIVTTLKTYVRSGTVAGEQLPAEAVTVADTLDLVNRLYAGNLRNVDLQTRLDPEACVMGRAERLVQVWTNLLLNAVQAIEARHSAHADAPRGRIRVLLEQHGPGVQVVVEDNGMGIAPEHQGRVFEQFFTTKPTGEGTGLGLAIARHIVAEHGGEISLSSQPGLTRFHVLLPCVHAEAYGPEAWQAAVQHAAARAAQSDLLFVTPS